MYEVIIIGAGPSGLMAGIQSNKKTLIIEKNSIAGKKLLITGGGRCNITNCKDNKSFLENIEINKKYLYSTINNFGPQDIINFFEANNVKLKIEDDDKVFPTTNKAYTILECLLKNNKSEIRYNENVINIIKENGDYIIKTNKSVYRTNKLIIATGGSSYKKTGSSGDNLNFAKILNQPIVSIYPAEVGVVLKRPTNIAGSSIDNVEVKLGKIRKNGPLLFTHRGLSGNSIMLASEYIYKLNLKEIEIDLLPNVTMEELERNLNNYNRDKEIKSFLNEYFTKKISDYLLEEYDNKKIKQFNKKEINHLLYSLKSKKFSIKNVENIDLAYVTGGGIDMKYINSKTMESTLNKGLYFVGEALDIHGPIGGYNLTLALSTGYTAGKNI